MQLKIRVEFQCKRPRMILLLMHVLHANAHSRLSHSLQISKLFFTLCPHKMLKTGGFSLLIDKPQICS